MVVGSDQLNKPKIRFNLVKGGKEKLPVPGREGGYDDNQQPKANRTTLSRSKGNMLRGGGVRGSSLYWCGGFRSMY
jgi:hypothetical protein